VPPWGIAAGVTLAEAVGGTFALHLVPRGVLTTLLALLVATLWIAGIAMLVIVLRNRPGFLATFAAPAIILVRPVTFVLWWVIVLVWRIIALILGYLATGPFPTILGPTDSGSGSVPQLPPDLEAVVNKAVRDGIAEAMRNARGPLWKRVAIWLATALVAAFLGWLMYYYIPAPPHATAGVITPPSPPTPHASQ
jgi:hypothetical protein